MVSEAFVGDFERSARFQREAEVLASLDHVNIGHIYGMVDGEGVRALVLAPLHYAVRCGLSMGPASTSPHWRQMVFHFDDGSSARFTGEYEHKACGG